MLINFHVRKILNGEKSTLHGVNKDYAFKDEKINGLQVNSWRDIYDYLVTQSENPEIALYGNRLERQEIEGGYVSYGTLAKCGNLVQAHNTEIISELYEQGFGYEYDGEEERYIDIFQVYIIDSQLKETIDRYMPDAYITWSDIAGAYVWGITHFGISWDYVNAFPIESLFK